MFKHRASWIVFYSLLVGVSPGTVGFLSAEMVATGQNPAAYAPLAANRDAVQKLSDQYKSGAISFTDFQAGLAQLEHHVTLTSTADDAPVPAAAWGRITASASSDIVSAVLNSPLPPVKSARSTFNANVLKKAGFPNKPALSERASTAKDVAVSSSAVQCPDGYTEFNPGQCENIASIDSAQVTILSTLFYNADGTPQLFEDIAGTGKVGLWYQMVAPDDASKPTVLYINEFLSADDYPSELAALKADHAQITFAGLLPQGYYQIQFH